MQNSIILSFFIMIFTSCADVYEEQVTYALEQAENNRTELEKILSHYKKDPEKLRAARFLIANTPFYYSYQGAVLDTLKQIKSRGYVTEEIKKKWRNFDFRSLPKLRDVKVITADLLIENIDYAFKAWQERPWAKYYSFEEFCEYILPYRIEDEPLEKWRAVYYHRYAPVLDSLYNGTDVVEAAKVIVHYLKKEGFNNTNDFTLPHLGAIYLLENRTGYCRENCDIAWYVLRALGIPVATDQYCVSPSYQSRHFWSALIDTTKQVVSFNYIEKEMERGKSDGRKKGKVYRRCFGVQPLKYDIDIQNKNIPALFRNSFIKDVTHEYFGENELSVILEKTIDVPYIYLAIYDVGQYVPIDIAEVNNSKATFHSLESGVIYHPVYYKDGKLLPVSYGILMEDSCSNTFIPDIHKSRQVILRRKYPMVNTHFFFGRAVGTKIEGDITRDFETANMLYSVVDTPEINYNEIILPEERYCRYIRYSAPENRQIELAELSVYSTDGRDLPFKYIYGIPKLDELHTSILDLIFDKDWVSFYMSVLKGEQLIFDLGATYPVKKIVWIPRNDDNFIHLGDRYELFYQNGLKGWVSLGRQTADSTCLLYDNVPDNALLWLHDCTRGKEERPFYYKNGKQIFP